MPDGSLHIRTVNGESLSPYRDLRYCYPQVMAETARRFNNDAWPELKVLVEKEGYTWDQLCDCMEAITGFLNSPITDASETMQARMEKYGVLAFPHVVRMAIFSMMGTVMLGQLYYAVCETTPLGAPPEDMAVIAEKVRVYLTQARQHANRPAHGYFAKVVALLSAPFRKKSA